MKSAKALQISVKRAARLQVRSAQHSAKADKCRQVVILVSIEATVCENFMPAGQPSDYRSGF
jgi:hypothetical protein